ncbi:hypothetical protein BH10ACI4_BH10ACI4_33790 [soil metagenome]
MKKDIGGNKNLDSYLESLNDSQKNATWPEVLRGSRSVDEFLWKGARNAPIVQRVGAIILALAYLIVGFVFVSTAVEDRSWMAGASAAILFGIGAWFIRNALKK